MLMENDTHKVKVSILRYLPVVWEDILGLDVVSRLFLLLVVIVVFLLLGCFVRVLLVKIVHEGWTNGLLGGGMSCGGEDYQFFNETHLNYEHARNTETKPNPNFLPLEPPF